MTFADQWANRHDGECEQGQETEGLGLRLTCRCYVRWLEGRLRVITRAAQDYAWDCTTFNRDALRLLVGKRDAVLDLILSPKGAGDE